MTRYLIEFERVGGNRNVESLVVLAASEADLAHTIRAYVRPWLRSLDFEVMIDLGAGAGWLKCGHSQSGGNFSITAAPVI